MVDAGRWGYGVGVVGGCSFSLEGAFLGYLMIDEVGEADDTR
jgi:hypothetical protein